MREKKIIPIEQRYPKTKTLASVVVFYNTLDALTTRRSANNMLIDSASVVDDDDALKLKCWYPLSAWMRFVKACYVISPKTMRQMETASFSSKPLSAMLKEIRRLYDSLVETVHSAIWCVGSWSPRERMGLGNIPAALLCCVQQPGCP